jgi:hypothetical protein
MDLRFLRADFVTLEMDRFAPSATCLRARSAPVRFGERATPCQRSCH